MSESGKSEKKRKRKIGSTRTVRQFSNEEKLEIISFAKSNGNRAAGREFNVAESSIREWRKNEERLRTEIDGDKTSDDSQTNHETKPKRQKMSVSLDGESGRQPVSSDSVHSSASRRKSKKPCKYINS